MLRSTIGDGGGTGIGTGRGKGSGIDEVGSGAGGSPAELGGSPTSTEKKSGFDSKSTPYPMKISSTKIADKTENSLVVTVKPRASCQNRTGVYGLRNHCFATKLRGRTPPWYQKLMLMKSEWVNQR